MRRISLSLLAGVALLSATAFFLPGASTSSSQPTTLGPSAQLVAVAPSGLTTVARPRPAARKSGLKQTLARLLADESAFTNPARPRARPRPALRSTAIQARPPIQPPQMGMACPVATGSRPGGCSIVPCAVYVGAGQTGYTVRSGPGPGLGLAILPRLIAKPSPGARTPAGTCVSRPGRPPQMRWVSSTGR